MWVECVLFIDKRDPRWGSEIDYSAGYFWIGINYLRKVIICRSIRMYCLSCEVLNEIWRLVFNHEIGYADICYALISTTTVARIIISYILIIWRRWRRIKQIIAFSCAGWGCIRRLRLYSVNLLITAAIILNIVCI
jgi:hypothetical protein